LIYQGFLVMELKAPFFPSECMCAVRCFSNSLEVLSDFGLEVLRSGDVNV
jgi:hypothetical protein